MDEASQKTIQSYVFAFTPVSSSATASLSGTNETSGSKASTSDSKTQVDAKTTNTEAAGVGATLGSRPHKDAKTSDEQIVMEPFEYILGSKGKNIRNRMIDAFNVWFLVDTKRVDQIKSLIERLHEASLLIDDIQDSSTLRRGKPCAHLVYGNARTINAANYAYFQAMNMIHSLVRKDSATADQTDEAPKAFQIFADEMMQLHQGQGMELFWRDTSHCPTLEKYQNMVHNKTGGLFRMFVKLLQLFGQDQTTTSYTNLINNLSLFFQIRDDYANLKLAEYSAAKSFAEDLTEGKYSFLVIHCLLFGPADNPLASILQQKTEKVALKRQAIELMEKTGSFDYCLQTLRNLHGLILAEIRDRKGNAALESILESLTKDIVGF